MKYIAALDYEHMDNGLFLTSIAQALAQYQSRDSGGMIVVHGESEYTERLIQTGIMRDEAAIRAIKDLNHRLIALFADQGVSAVGFNGYQRQSITLQEGSLSLNRQHFDSLHKGPVLVLSTLVYDTSKKAARPVALPRLLEFLHEQFAPKEVFIFSRNDLQSRPGKQQEPDDSEAPEEFSGLSVPARLTTAAEFQTQIISEKD